MVGRKPLDIGGIDLQHSSASRNLKNTPHNKMMTYVFGENWRLGAFNHEAGLNLNRIKL